jgi:hypothetical protein
MKSLALLLLTLNTSFAASNLVSFKAAKKSLIAGTFQGVVAYSKNEPCTATLKVENDQIVASIDFLNWKNEPATSTVVFNPSDAVYDLSFDPDLYGEEDQRTARLTKHKEIPEEGSEDMFLDIYESVVQEIDGDTLLSFSIEEFILNEHSDPSESRLECRINL